MSRRLPNWKMKVISGPAIVVVLVCSTFCCSNDARGNHRVSTVSGLPLLKDSVGILLFLLLFMWEIFPLVHMMQAIALGERFRLRDSGLFCAVDCVNPENEKRKTERLDVINHGYTRDVRCSTASNT